MLLFAWTQESLSKWIRGMKWLDRWGYITACLSFLILGMLVFAHSWVVFAQTARDGFLPATITFVNDLLLVIILLELFRTVVGFLQDERIRLEPFLHVGIIASVRRILTLGAEKTHIGAVSGEMFDQYLMDIGLHITVILILIVSVYMIHKIHPATNARSS